MTKTFIGQLATQVFLVCLICSHVAIATEVHGLAVDADSGDSLPCRLYVQNADSGEWHFAKSVSADGSAVECKKQIGTSASIEMHTTLSAGKFTLQLSPGKYRIHA